MGIRTGMTALAAAGLLLSGFLTGCSAEGAGTATEPPSVDQVSEQTADDTYAALEALRIDTSSVTSIIDGLDALKVDERPADIIASVQPGELQLEPGGITLPLPDDEFYVSIAPYFSETHPCTYHSLTTCLGELANTPVELTITDTETGEAVVQGITATADNGFVGAWLARDREYTVRIVTGEGYAEELIRTGKDDPTCITTMQLQPIE